jgi:DNA primase large subunit
VCGSDASPENLIVAIFRVPFQQALSLVASRSIYLERGYAYVPLQKLVSIIVTKVL